MADLTVEFRRIVTNLDVSTTEKPKRTDILPPTKKNFHNVNDSFLKEAYEIASHINNLKAFLLSIRKVYLNLSHSSVGVGSPRKMMGYNATSFSDIEEKGFSPKISASIQTLTDKERDDIDLHAKVIMQRCMDRIKKLEEAEEGVGVNTARQNSIMNNPLLKILPTLRTPNEHDIIAAHRSSVTWLLNMRLMQVSKIQKELQESRIRREIEKRERSLLKPTTNKPMTPPLVLRDSSDEKDSSSKNKENNVDTNVITSEDDDIERYLSAEQKMMLEMENESMMKELESTLDQVNQAEKALLEISNLQSVLSSHLAVQTQQTDRLYAEAIATTDRVQEGNLMLVKARQRAQDARKGILIFLILASFILLFLDWYD
ncbi:1317_t:CDS:2 [Ambispora leptoticha]|uniref:1317_t:CDS:1 n=1 Tax=Ambispora leptoticha TaxID=144679 RepID=A0A9N9A2Y2_9GLOM|nr:1317_t:CDS:2 [Ambispora leptoticha]